MAEKRFQRKNMTEINVTPLVDISMSLLIIFMVTAPMIQQGVKVDLPKAAAKTIESGQEKLVLTLKADKSIYLAEVPIPLEELQDKIRYNPRIQSDGELYLHADRRLDYGFVVDIMARIQEAGVTKLGMITDPGGSANEE